MTVPRCLLDLNIILDFFQDRAPHAEHAEQLFAAAQEQRVSLWISGDAPSTLCYVLEKQFRQQRENKPHLKAQGIIRRLLDQVSVAPVTKSSLERAISFGMEDYEDAIQASAAVEAGVGTLVTRDLSGYRDLPPDLLAVLSPLEALGLLGAY
jgi:predicted nucleic acid-binding protein